MSLLYSSLFCFVRGLGLAALVVVAHSEILRLLKSHPRSKQAACGVLFGFAAAAGMLTPAFAVPAEMVDARTALIALAAAFSGPAACLIAVVLAGAFRLWLGGVGMIPGLAGLMLAAVASLIYTATIHRPPREFRLRHLGMLGAAASTSVFCLMLLPHDLISSTPVALSVLALRNILGVMLVGTMFVREGQRLEAENALRVAAMMDPLTDLHNRRAFNIALQDCCAEEELHGRGLAVLLIDVDLFKTINDTLGHDVGDTALITIGRTLRMELRRSDHAARLGGDEFGVCLPFTSLPEADEIASHVCKQIAAATLAALGTAVNVSIGIAAVSASCKTPSELLKAADRSLYRAKAHAHARESTASRSIAA